MPVPAGGIGRVLIYKTYKDPRTYTMHGDDIVWVRSLSGYRLGVLLPKGFAFLSSNVAAQLSTTADGRLKLAFANPSGQSNPVTIHARRTGRHVHAHDRPRHVLRRREDALRSRRAGVASPHRRSELQRLPEGRDGHARLAVLPAARAAAGDRSRHRASALTPVKTGAATTVALDVPITNDKQSAHLRITGTLTDPAYTIDRGDLVFARTLKGLRNTVLLPAGWEVSEVSQPATHRPVRRPRVRRADQPQRRESVPACASARAAPRRRRRTLRPPLAARGGSHGAAPRRARRPAGKARRLKISSNI